MFSFTRLKNAFEYFLARSASDQPRGCVGPELGETEQTVTDTITVCKLPSLCGGHPLEKQSKASGKASLGICFHWNRSCFTPSHNQQKKCRTWSRVTIQLRKKMGGKTNSTGSQMTSRLHHILVQPEEAETPKNFGLQMGNLGTLNQNCQVPRMWIQGLHWQSSDEGSMLPMQGAQFQSLVREWVPTGCNHES